jgi:hypothetical protein
MEKSIQAVLIELEFRDQSLPAPEFSNWLPHEFCIGDGG